MSQPAAVASASFARSSPRCQLWSSLPRFPSGFARLWSGPATKPSSEIDIWQVVSDIGVLRNSCDWQASRTVPTVLTYNQMVVDEKPIRDDEGATDLLFRALADPIRRDILRRAHEGRLSVSALAREHPISVTAMQKHVAVLERAELVSKHRVGRESIVKTEADALVRPHAALNRLEADWRDRIERMEEILKPDKGKS